MTEKLKPCPFCRNANTEVPLNGEAWIHAFEQWSFVDDSGVMQPNGFFAVACCGGCGVQQCTVSYRSEDEAIAAWNNREGEREGYVLVPAEPTVSMIEAAFKSIRMWNKGTKECVKLWAPRAGARHPHEPGIVTEIRAAILAGTKEAA